MSKGIPLATMPLPRMHDAIGITVASPICLCDELNEPLLRKCSMVFVCKGSDAGISFAF